MMLEDAPERGRTGVYHIFRRLSQPEPDSGPGILPLVFPLAAEQARWVLWLPVLFGCGVATYFARVGEPAMWPAWVAAVVLAGLLYVCRRRMVLLLPVAALLAAALGFAAAQIRTETVATPMLTSRIGSIILVGRVLLVEETAYGRRVTLDRVRATDLRDGIPPTIRLSAREGRGAGFVVGDWVRVSAALDVAPLPAAPDAFDMQRFLYFGGIGALGQVRAPPETVGPPANEEDDSRIRFARFRAELTQRVLAVLPGDVGAVAAALITGDQTAISPATMQAMRDSGLAHLLSISGLHIGLVAGFMFYLVRAGLALIPSIALRHPIKKWAALTSIVAIAFYSTLAGWNVPVQRSFIMCAFGLLAVMIDRQPISLRIVAWSALAVLVAGPEALLGPSFQMSFGAVIALIAGYEVAAPAFARWRKDSGWMGRAGIWLTAMVFTSVLATIATTPFAAYHFNRFAVYGLISNLVALPLSGVLIMPAAVFAVLLMPFGLEHLALVPMGWGVDLVNRTAEAVAALPGAVIRVPALPDLALGLMVAGGLWMALWRLSWRWAGILPIAAGVWVAVVARSPDLLITADARLVGIVTTDKGLALSTAFGRAGRLAADTWMGRLGDDRSTDLTEAAREGEGNDLLCEAGLCRAERGGLRLAVVQDPRRLRQACAQADIVIAHVAIRQPCDRPRLVLDRKFTAREGAASVTLTPTDQRWASNIILRSDRMVRGTRPWVIRPPEIE